MGLGFLYFVTSESWDEHHCAMFNLAWLQVRCPLYLICGQTFP
jgi:hypothetical protein